MRSSTWNGNNKEESGAGAERVLHWRYSRKLAARQYFGSADAGYARSGWVRAGAGELPALALIKELLNPTIVVLALLFSTLLHDQPFTGPYRVLAVIAFVVAIEVMGRPRLEPVDSARWLLRDMRRVVWQWSCAVALLLLVGFLLRRFRGLLTQDPAYLVHGHAGGAARRTVGRATCHGVARPPGNDYAPAGSGGRQRARLRSSPRGWLRTRRRASYKGSSTIVAWNGSRASAPSDSWAALATWPTMSASTAFTSSTSACPSVHKPRINALLEELRDTTASIYFVPDSFHLRPDPGALQPDQWPAAGSDLRNAVLRTQWR